MRLSLLLLLTPLFSYSQSDTIVTYHQKEVHTITYKADSSTTWVIDTIKYSAPFEIKFSKGSSQTFLDEAGNAYMGMVPAKISIDGYTTYTVTKHEIHGVNDRNPGFHYYQLSNGAKLTWIEKWLILDFPVVNKKMSEIVFTID